MSATARAVEVGDVLEGRYRVDRRIGQGGMGCVFAATNLATGGLVALKMLLPEHAANADLARRFLREARAAAAIQHENVIVVHDVLGTPADLPVIVMEFLEGRSLADLLKERKVLKLGEAVPIFLDVAAGLCAAHAQGIVHRDLKPDNIFLTNDREGRLVAKVLDFGIAKILEPSRLAVQSYGSATRQGALLGTLPYMSYEQAMSLGVDTRTDAWSFAVTMIESLCGRRPLVFGPISEMYVAMLKQRVPRAQAMVPSLSSELASALDECLHKLPNKRARDLKRMVAVLEAYREQVPSRWGKVPRAAWLALGALLAGGVALVSTAEHVARSHDASALAPPVHTAQGSASAQHMQEPTPLEEHAAADALPVPLVPPAEPVVGAARASGTTAHAAGSKAGRTRASARKPRPTDADVTRASAALKRPIIIDVLPE